MPAQHLIPVHDRMIANAARGLSDADRARFHKLVSDQLRGVRDRRDSDVRWAIEAALTKVRGHDGRGYADFPGQGKG